jgi:amino acid transporter
MSHTNSFEQPDLVRGIGLTEATSLNMIDMIGVGPFITLPLVIAAAGGPQAMLGWILGAVFALCDGLVWAELGAAMPNAGGSYRYLKEIYGPDSLGRLLSFLFIWQLSFSAPLSIASGCIGLAHYAGYLWPGLERVILAHTIHFGPLEVSILVMPATWVGDCNRGSRGLPALSPHHRARQAGGVAVGRRRVGRRLGHRRRPDALQRRARLRLSPGAFTLSPAFFMGMGSAMLIATYDYWGYYNVCFLGGEVKDPGRTIPRALIISILVVAALYLTMNVAVLGVIPWREMVSHSGGENNHIISVFMQRIYGNWAGRLITGLIMWTAFASVFSTLLGYSRVPYAAALDGNYFRAFARVDPKRRFPTVSLLALGGVAMLFCFLRLADVIAALVVIRILLQFIVQAVGVMVLRHRRPDMPRPFRMWLYPVPALMAIAGFTFILLARKNFLREIRYALAILVVGIGDLPCPLVAAARVAVRSGRARLSRLCEIRLRSGGFEGAHL